MRLLVWCLLASLLFDRCGNDTYNWHVLWPGTVYTQPASAAPVGGLRRAKSHRLLTTGCLSVFCVLDNHCVGIANKAAPTHRRKRSTCVEFSLGTARVRWLA